MLTKLYRLLFVPTVWETIKTETLKGKERKSWSDNWNSIHGTQYTLKNQYGDIKFRTVWCDGQEGERN